MAYRNLTQSKARLLVSVGGVALALMLIVSLDAIFAGVERQIVAYVVNSKADVFVSQAGVRNMHMASSALPSSVVGQVRAVPGVQSATPVLYLTNVVGMGEERNLAYVIGLPRDAAAGTPWRMAAGAPIPEPGQAVVDTSVARRSGITLGDRVTILGREFTVAGLSLGTRSLINSIAFISIEDFWRIRGGSDSVSFVLVRVQTGETPEAVALRIQDEVSGVTAQTTAEFAEQERRTVSDMSTDVVTIMNLVGFLIGLAVMALTTYTATFARRAEFGVLKALGARNSHLYRAVIAQALYSVGLGLALGLAFALALSFAVRQLDLELELVIRVPSLLKAVVASVVIAGFSAILPVTQVARLDPAMVYRKGGG